MTKDIIISHDVGTSSVKSILINTSGEILGESTQSYPFYTPHPGWAEQDPSDYWKAIVKNTRALIEKSDKKKILGMVFTTQAMGVIPIDKEGVPLMRNISWVDGRAEEQARWMMNLFGGRAAFKGFLGIEITGKDVIPKLRWIKQKRPQIYERTHKFLDVNGYLRFQATGKMAAEWSGASSYGFNLKKKDWEHLFFRVVGVDNSKLPDLIRSVDIAGTLTGKAAEELNLDPTTMVFGGCDDTQSAAVGAGCVRDGSVYAYIGTAAQIGGILGKSLKFKNGAACLQSADPNLNLMIGVTETAGNNVEWLIQQFYREELKALGKKGIYELLNKEASEIPAGSDHLIYTPWCLGERCPVSTTTTRGTLFNMGMEHTRAHITRALFEGIGYNLRWIIENYEKDFKFDIPDFRFIGGGSLSTVWMHTIADITGRTIITTNYPTMAGAIGAALCGFVGAGIFKDFQEVDKIVHPAKKYIPNPDNKEIYDKLFLDYKDLYRSLKNTYQRANLKRFNT